MESPAPLATVRPSGPQSMLPTQPVITLETPNRAARGRFPNLHRIVLPAGAAGTGSDQLAIRREGERLDRPVLMAGIAAQFLTCFRIP